MKENHILETKGVTINFNGLVAVDNVDFKLLEGESVGIIGPNGAGKTTFFNLITGFFPPTKGKIFFYGKDITNNPPHKRARMGIIRTFQLVSVFDSLSVLDNLLLSIINSSNIPPSKDNFYFAEAHKEDLKNLCLSSLSTLGLEQKAYLMTSELSYGDKRKLEIAVALSMNPKMLLLDEPFAGLSDQEIIEVSKIIKEFKKGFSMVIIEHKISRIVELVERLCVMHEGRLIAEGIPNQVLCDPLVREVYWGKEDGLVCSV
ncbi:MAG: ABC transporter ATP-binding protein [Syntrophorhabdaceae bacterium]|nr:ABC transporter ATP-binding protein [Syntrophorhabdaceae bacterium]